MIKSQTKIDNFFINKNPKSDSIIKKSEIKKYFYLLWTNKSKPNCNGSSSGTYCNAYWTDKKPEKINFIHQVNCNYFKQGFVFNLCGYFDMGNENDSNNYYHLNKEKIYKNVHYLKSHLQKCIRKQDDNRAVQTCMHMIKLDIMELMRRLPIIMIEDTYLHESFTTLMWLMIACGVESFKPKPYIYEWILGLIYVLCKIEKKDKFLNRGEAGGTVEESLDNFGTLSNEEMSLLYCMHLRIAYGGMDGDIQMLKMGINNWYYRFKNKTRGVNMLLLRPISVHVQELKLADWDIAAIDYHCCPNFLKLIFKKYDDLDIDEKELKNIIWYNSSGLNTREKKGAIYNPEIWNNIKDYIRKTQKYLLDSGY
jgi:hypothetical protein